MLGINFWVFVGEEKLWFLGYVMRFSIVTASESDRDAGVGNGLSGRQSTVD